MIAERTKDGLLDLKVKEMIDKLDGELAKAIDDFTRAMDVEALYLAKKSGEYSLSQSGDS